MADQTEAAVPESVPFPWRRMLAVAGLVVALAALVRYGDFASLHPATVKAWVAGFGSWGPLAYLGFWIVGVMVAAPATLLLVVGALVFPLGWALFLAWLGALVGTSVTFWVARTLGRRFVARRLGPRVARYDAALARRGFRLVLLMRLSGIPPANLFNLAAGLTRVRYRDYILATALGVIPFVVVVVTIASRVGASPTFGDIVRDPVLYAALAGVLLLVGMGRLLRPWLTQTGTSDGAAESADGADAD